MSDGKDAVPAKLRDELQAIARQTCELIASVGVRWEPDRLGRVVRVCQPNGAERAAAAANAKRFAGWTAAVTSLVARHTTMPPDEVRSIADDFAAHVALTAKGDPYVIEKVWRQKTLSQMQSLSERLFGVLNRLDETPVIPSAMLPFRLRVAPQPENRWHVEAALHGKRATELVAKRFTESEIEKVIRGHCGPRQTSTTLDVAALQAFGQALFASVIVKSVADLYAMTAGTDICMEIDSRDCPELPWEALHDGRDFLCLMGRSSVVRFLPGSPNATVEDIRSPLRILITPSTPRGCRWLDLDKERERIEEALAPLLHDGSVTIDVAPDGRMATAERLLRAARTAGRPYSAWHFSGHGGAGVASQSNVLAMMTAEGEAHDAEACDFCTLISDFPELRLAVLNACEAGAGTSLVSAMRGIPAVVAMQYEISDDAAITFAGELYGALADGASLERAVTMARRTLFFAPNYSEWVTPVLYVRRHGCTS